VPADRAAAVRARRSCDEYPVAAGSAYRPRMARRGEMGRAEPGGRRPADQGSLAARRLSRCAASRRLQRSARGIEEPLLYRRPARTDPEYGVGRRLGLTPQCLRGAGRDRARRRRRHQLCPQKQPPARRQGRRSFLSGYLQCRRFAADLDPSNEPDRVAQRVCRAGLRRKNRAPAGGYGRRRRDVDRCL
jgi:hypothetical protein